MDRLMNIESLMSFLGKMQQFLQFDCSILHKDGHQQRELLHILEVVLLSLQKKIIFERETKATTDPITGRLQIESLLSGMKAPGVPSRIFLKTESTIPISVPSLSLRHL